MIVLLQRVLEASVTIDGVITAQIEDGLLALVGVERHDTETEGERLSQRMLGYRIFGDAAGRMNRDLRDTAGGLLLVPQFTLAADTTSGRRPGFSTAAAPERAEFLFARFVEDCRAELPDVRTGSFGAHMQIASINDGPVTFHLRVVPSEGESGGPQA